MSSKKATVLQRPYQGRIGRRQFLIGMAISIAGVSIGVAFTGAFRSVLIGLFAESSLPSFIFVILILLSLAVFAFSAYIAWGLLVRRWHDLGASGWCVLLHLVPYLNILAILVLVFVPGNKHENDFGPKTRSFNIGKILFNNKGERQKIDEYFDYAAPIAVFIAVIYFYFVWLPF